MLLRALRVKKSAKVTDGEKIFALNPNNANVWPAAGKAFGVTREALRGLVLRAISEGEATMETAELDPAEKPVAPTYTLRFGGVEEQREKHGELQGSSLLSLLLKKLPLPDTQLLTWDDTDALCCLDIDYHDCKPPGKHALESWVESSLAPKPVAWHFSRGGGLHCFYVGTDSITGEELAAAAAIRWRTLDPTAGVELKHSVRAAGALRVVTRDAQDATALSFWVDSGTADEEEIATWLEEHQMVMDGKYAHELCPINACASHGEPVQVGKHGITCHRCTGTGHALGGRKPGFASWAALTGTPSSGLLGAMIKNLVHWGHARWVLTVKYNIPEPLARLGYSAALKVYHAGRSSEGHVSQVFNRDLDNLARSNDSWMNLNSFYTYPTNLSQPLIQALPATWGAPDEKGKVRPVASTVAYLQQGMNLTNRGYANIQVVHGYRLASQFLSLPDTHVSIYPPELQQAPTKVLPAYVPKTKRMKIDEAEAIVESIFPGIEWRCVRGLLCATASAQETRLGLTPMLFIAGTAGAAKTMTCKVAMGIVGSAVEEVTYKKEEERMKQAIIGGTQRAGLVVANEFLKDAERATGKYDPRAALETLLTLTPDTACHVMYVGSRRLSNIPALVLTEPELPYSVKDYDQVARRLRYIRLYGRKDVPGCNWKANTAELKLKSDTVYMWRTRTPELTAAANALMSDVIDNFFSTPMSWDDQADELGLKTVRENTEDFDDPTPHMRRLFSLICELPEIEKESPLYRYYKGGYKQIRRQDSVGTERDAADLYSIFCDGGGLDWMRSKRLAEKDWAHVLGVTDHIVFDLKSDRNTHAVYVRFRVGPPDAPTKVNGAIINLPLEEEV